MTSTVLDVLLLHVTANMCINYDLVHLSVKCLVTLYLLFMPIPHCASSGDPPHDHTENQLLALNRPYSLDDNDFSNEME